MNLAQARGRVARVLRMAGDSEAAHEADDDLRKDFISAVARGVVSCSDAAEIAKLLLTTESRIERWYA